MAEKKQTTEAGDIAEKVVSEAAASTPAYTLEKLRKYCVELFGVTSSTFDGATNDLDGGKEYTKEEIKRHIETCLAKEVKV